MNPEHPADFGARLKAARLRKGVSLRTISDVTRISVSLLEALERNDVSKLPGGLFSRSFVRAYAREIDLDPERTVEEFLERFPHDSVNAAHRASVRWGPLEALEQRRRLISFTRSVALLVLLGGGVLTLLWFSGGSAILARPVAALVRAASPVVTLPAMPQFNASRAPLVVTLLASRACSGSSAVDGRLPQAFVLVSGEQRTIEATQEISLTVSEADAVMLAINGLPARPLGGPESTVIRLTVDDYRTFLDR